MMCVLLSMATVDTVDLGPPMAIFQVALVISTSYGIESTERILNDFLV